MDYKSPSNMEIKQWSDKRCLEISLQGSFPAAVKDLKVQKNIISRYLNFYLGGKIQKGLSVRDLTFAVIAIMPISWSLEEFIWPETEYSQSGDLFFLTTDDKLKYDIDKVFMKRTVEHEDNLKDEQNTGAIHFDMKAESFKNNADSNITNNKAGTSHVIQQEESTALKKDTLKGTSEEPNKANQEKDTLSSEPSSSKPMAGITSLRWYRVKLDVPTKVTSLPEKKYGPVENANFCILCNNLLDAWETKVSGRIALKCFFALVALFVLPSKAKTFQTLTKYFNKKFDDCIDSGELDQYTTPHRNFLKKSWKAFHETDPRNQIMFAKLVILSLVHPTRLNNYGKANIIKYAVLTHTAYAGMGIIKLLQQLASCDNSEFNILFTSLYSNETADSWLQVNNFFKKYLNEEAKQHTFHWAGVIESECVKNLSYSNNYVLAIVIAVFIEKITNNSGIWQSAWVDKINNLEEYKQLGYKMYNDYQERREAFLTEEIKSLLSLL